MKKWILSLLIVIGTVTSSFSQTFYPRKAVWKTDTVLLITKPQLITINKAINERNHLRLINTRLQLDIDLADSLSSYWRQMYESSSKMYSLEAEKYNNLSFENETLKVELKNEQNKSRKIGIGVGVGGTLLGIVLGVLLGK